jgi:hypothetical protein
LHKNARECQFASLCTPEQPAVLTFCIGLHCMLHPPCGAGRSIPKLGRFPHTGCAAMVQCLPCAAGQLRLRRVLGRTLLPMVHDLVYTCDREMSKGSVHDWNVTETVSTRARVFGSFDGREHRVSEAEDVHHTGSCQQHSRSCRTSAPCASGRCLLALQGTKRRSQQL